MRLVHWSITTSTPVRAQYNRFTTKQVETPQTVLRVTEQREPRRPRGLWSQLVPNGEHATHHILVDGNAERHRDLLRDPWTTPGRMSLFHVDDGCDNFLAGSLWARLRLHIGPEEPVDTSAVSALDESPRASRV